MNSDDFSSRVNSVAHGLRYINIIMGGSFIVNIYFFYRYTFKNSSYLIGLLCLITAISTAIDFSYILHKKAIFHNLILSVIAFITLFITLYWFSGDEYAPEKLWIFLLPGMFIYTQSINKKTLFIIVVPLSLIAGKLIYSIVTQCPCIMINLEHFIVFSAILGLNILYSKSITRSTKQMTYQHYYNQLTGLPNRKRLRKDLQNRQYTILALINIDAFKNINSLYGTAVGDKVLIIVSERLNEFIAGREGYSLYKLHADEYAISIAGSVGIHKDIDLLSTLAHSISDMITIGPFEIYPTVTIGVGHGYESLVEDADMALKSARDTRKSIVVFDKSIGIEEQYRRDLSTVYKLKSGLKRDGLKSFYQPIVNLSNGNHDKYECLARLEYNGEIIPPISFINVSKEVKIYHKITKIMIDKTFENFAGRDQSFSINLDWDDLMDEGTTDFIRDKVVEYDNGRNVIFELLETQEIDNAEKVVEFIESVKELGCRIAIDDFGSGYSNFDYLLKFKIDFLKIDGALIKNIDVDKNSLIMTKSIVSFAKELGIKTIAEHIDKESILTIVKDLGIDYGQGYFWSAPKPESGSN